MRGKGETRSNVSRETLSLEAKTGSSDMLKGKLKKPNGAPHQGRPSPCLICPTVPNNAEFRGTTMNDKTGKQDADNRR
ncbi:MAG: hypothetical protein A4E62_01560 [Syntrophorhabdus sp. PtaU1.Bin002]|nr:MAG: hypothetical protein A4E62_01560 [Syntrophorhabdus sp. PtaU1.Bin002]